MKHSKRLSNTNVRKNSSSLTMHSYVELPAQPKIKAGHGDSGFDIITLDNDDANYEDSEEETRPLMLEAEHKLVKSKATPKVTDEADV